MLALKIRAEKGYEEGVPIKEKKRTPALPGIVQCQTIKLTVPSGRVSGLATKP